MALELAKTGKKILIIERGEHLPREIDNWSPKAVFIDKKYRTKETWLDKDGKVLKPNTNYWVGGNTSFYGAALMRMKRRDFENVEHVDGISPAWPIKYDEWAPWYEKAEKLWQVHGKRGIDPNDEKTDPEYPYPAIIDDEGVAKLKEYFHNLGWHPSPLPLGIRRDDMHPFMSVSYTHLDVYKRQHSASTLPATSLADSSGAPSSRCSGHSTPTVGSFQARLRSNCGA